MWSLNMGNGKLLKLFVFSVCIITILTTNVVNARSRVIYDNGTVIYTNNSIDEIRNDTNEQNEQREPQTEPQNEENSANIPFFSYGILLLIGFLLCFSIYVGYKKMTSGREEEITW